MKGCYKETNTELSKKIFGENQINKSIFKSFFSNLHDKNDFSIKFKHRLLSLENHDLNSWLEFKKGLPEKVSFSLGKKERVLSIKYGELINENTNKIKKFY